MDKPLAEKGNHELLRSCFFQFRELVQQKIIPWSSFLPEDSKYLNERITYNSIWNTEQASFVYNFLSKFNNEVVIHKIPLHEVTDPGIKQKHVPAKTIGVESSSNFIGYDGTNLIVRFKFNEYWVKEIKAIQGSKWNPEKKHWTVPLLKMDTIKQFADKYKFDIGENAMRMMYNVEENLEQSYSAERVELGFTLRNGEHEPFDYQTVGIDFQIRIKRSLNADDMGLGKSIQGIGFAIGTNKWPVLVLTPKNAKYNWQNEWKMWTNKKVLVADEKVMRDLPVYIEMGVCDVLIINFHSMKNYLTEQLTDDSVTLNRKARLFKALIIDEVHELRNEKTILFRIAKEISKGLEYKTVLSGTPIVNGMNDMASILDILGYLDTEFGGRGNFNKKYGTISKKQFEKGQKDKSELLLKELNLRLRSICMIRREKYQVLKDLPDKIRTTHEIDISNRSEYDLAYNSFQDYLIKSGASSAKISMAMRAEIMVRMGVLRKLSAKGKIEAFIEFANELFISNEKIVLFAWHKEILQIVKKVLPDMLLITGDQKDEEVRDNVYAFQNDPNIRIIGATFKRGSTALTMTAASHLACLEFPWTDAILNQAESRIHRISQKYTAFCHHFIGRNTIDNYILNDIIGAKRHLSKYATDSKEEVEEIMSENLLETIIRVAKK